MAFNPITEVVQCVRTTWEASCARPCKQAMVDGGNVDKSYVADANMTGEQIQQMLNSTEAGGGTGCEPP